MQAGRLLRWARLHSGQPQQALSARTGVAQSTISRIESGAFDPHFGVLRRLLRACGHDLELAPVPGYGVDRSELRLNLERTPAERIAAVAATSNALAPWRGVARRPGRTPSRHRKPPPPEPPETTDA